MAASSPRTLGWILAKCGSCSSGLGFSSHLSRQVLIRPMCLSSVLRRKDVSSRGQTKFTVEFIKKQVEEFDIGKRRLADMMGEDPGNFSQRDVDRSIAYLFPSSLFETRARPLMKHPDEIFPKLKAAQWGEDRRPFHFLFYTGKPLYYSLMHETYERILNLERYQDRLQIKGVFAEDGKRCSAGASRWLNQKELHALLLETVSSKDYDRFIQLMDRLLRMPYSGVAEDFLLRYRKQLEAQSAKERAPPLETDARGVAFSRAEGWRKSSTSSVVLRDGGSGRVGVNGRDMIQYFGVLQDREQLMFPIQFTGMLGRFDLECTVSGGGQSSQAGALRLAISRALLTFLSEGEMENMRQAGLLTPDPRLRERDKPGQEGARRKFTWKKR